MSAKQVVLDAVCAMPDGASWQEILQQIERLASHEPTGVNGSTAAVVAADESNVQRVRRLHPTTEADRKALEADLDAMAADPEIQSELRNIEAEFASTDWDGMEGF